MTSSIIDEILLRIKSIKGELLSKGVIEVILYGSVLYPEEFDRGASDIDLMLIIHDDIYCLDKISDFLEPIYEALRGFPIDPVVYPLSYVRERLKLRDAFFMDVITYGVPAFGSRNIRGLRASTKVSVETILSELSFMAVVLGRILMNIIDCDIQEAANRLYHLAKFALATYLMAKEEKLITRPNEIVEYASKHGLSKYCDIVNTLREYRRNIERIDGDTGYCIRNWDKFMENSNTLEMLKLAYKLLADILEKLNIETICNLNDIIEILKSKPAIIMGNLLVKNKELRIILRIIRRAKEHQEIPIARGPLNNIL